MKKKVYSVEVLYLVDGTTTRDFIKGVKMVQALRGGRGVVKCHNGDEWIYARAERIVRRRIRK